MINRRFSSVEKHSTPNGNGASGTMFSSPPAGQFLYNRSISTPSPSLPKAIPIVGSNRSRSVFSQSLSVDADIPPCSAPVTFNRYINVSCNTGTTPEGSSPTSWYARLSSSLKKSVLRRSTSIRESTQRRRNGTIQRKSVTILVF